MIRIAAALLTLCAGIQLALGAAPVNDDFGHAITLAGESGVVSGTVEGATEEPGELFAEYSYGQTVWYRWTAPASGALTFQATGTPVAIVVFSGVSQLNELYSTTRVWWPEGELPLWRGGAVEVWKDQTVYLRVDAAEPGGAFQLQYSLARGGTVSTYDIVKRVRDDGSGAFSMNIWRAPWGPGETDVEWELVAENPTPGAEAPLATGSVHLGFQQFGTARVPYPPAQLPGTEASLLFRLKSATNGVALAPDSVTRIKFQQPPTNDDFANSQTLTGASGSVSGSLVGANKETGEYLSGDGTQTVWYDWTAPADGPVVFGVQNPAEDIFIYTVVGQSLQTLNFPSFPPAVVFGDYSFGRDRVSFVAKAGVQYRLRLEDVTGRPAREFVLEWQMPAGGVIYFDSPQRLVAEDAVVGSGPDLRLRRYGSLDTAAEVQYVVEYGTADASDIRMPQPAVVQFNPGQSDAYIRPLILNDSAAEGREYLTVRLTGVNGVATLGQKRKAVITIEDDDAPRPANNDPAGAIVLPGEAALVNGTLKFAAEGGYPGGRGVWYRWTATQAAEVKFWAKFHGGLGIGNVAVYTGDAEHPTFDAFQYFAGAYAYYGTTVPRGQFTSEVGKTYYFQVVDWTPEQRLADFTLAVDGSDGIDSDGDGWTDAQEAYYGTNPHDADSDDDGIPDAQEQDATLDTDGDGLINALDPDSDNDGLFDGTELGVTTPGPDTDVAAGHFIPDADPNSQTSPLVADYDGGGALDGYEDVNHNGRVDPGESDPTNNADELPGAIEFTAARYEVVEGQAAQITVRRYGNLRGIAVGQYSISYRPWQGGAATDDLENASGTFSFADGESLQTISIPTNADTAFEDAEIFNVYLAPVENARYGDRAGAEVTILNDDPYVPVPGSIAGVLREQQQPYGAVGMFRVQLSTSGRFSGSVTLGRERLGFRGVLQANGTATVALSRGRKLVLEMIASGQTLTASIVPASGPVLVAGSGSRAAAAPGPVLPEGVAALQYTMGLAGQSGGGLQAQAQGAYGTAVLSRNGRLRVTLVFRIGGAITSGAVLDEKLNALIRAPFRGGGGAYGTLVFRPGLLSIRGTVGTIGYLGKTEARQAFGVRGAQYVAPAAGESVLGATYNGTPFTAHFRQAAVGFRDRFSFQAQLTAEHRWIEPAPAGHAVAVAIDPKTGIFRGRALDQNGQVVTMEGVVVQKFGYFQGWFSGVNAHGLVTTEEQIVVH